MKTWEELYEQAEKDHAAFRGKTVLSNLCGVSNDSDTDEREFDPPLAVVVDDQPLSFSLDTQKFHNDGLLDVYYSAHGPVPHDSAFHVWWIFGPTYHLDGTVEYPDWWPKPGPGISHQELRQLLDKMAGDNDGDVRAMAEAIKSYSDDCPDEQLVSQVQAVTEAFIDVLNVLRDKLTPKS